MPLELQELLSFAARAAQIQVNYINCTNTSWFRCNIYFSNGMFLLNGLFSSTFVVMPNWTWCNYEHTGKPYTVQNLIQIWACCILFLFHIAGIMVLYFTSCGQCFTRKYNSKVRAVSSSLTSSTTGLFLPNRLTSKITGKIPVDLPVFFYLIEIWKNTCYIIKYKYIYLNK